MSEQAVLMSGFGDMAGGIASIGGMLGIGGTASSGTTNINQNVQQILNLLQTIQSQSATTTTQTGTTDQQTQQDALSSMIQSLQQQQASTTQQLAGEDIDFLRDQMQSITGELNRFITADFSSEEATRLASNARDAAVTQVLEAGMDEVLKAGTTAGAFDSTVQRDVARDLAVRASTAGAESELATQAQFGQLNVAMMGQLSQSMTQLFDVLKGAESTTEATTQQETTGEETQTGTTQTTGQQTQTGTSQTESTQTTDTQQETDTTTETEQTQEQEQENTGILDIFGL